MGRGFSDTLKSVTACAALVKCLSFPPIRRMSAEDLEIHQPAGPALRSQYIPLRGSLDDGLDNLQKGRGILYRGSLPSLLEYSPQTNEDEHVDAGGNDVHALSLGYG